MRDYHYDEKNICNEYLNIGSSIQPFNAWLLIGGLRTLTAKIERITKIMEEVVTLMKQHPKGESVLFPFDKSSPQYELVKTQMRGACGLFTFILQAPHREAIVKFSESLRHILMAVSWECMKV